MIKSIHIFWIAVGLLFCCIIASFFVPQSKLSSSEYKYISHWAYTMNQNCPQTSAFGQLEKVEFKDNKIVWNIRIFGNDSIENFYKLNINIVRENYENYIYILYLTNQGIKYLLDKDISFIFRIYLPNGGLIEENFNLANIMSKVSSTSYTTQRALYNIFETCLNCYTNYCISTPIVLALTTMFPPNEACPYEVNMYDEHIIVIDWKVYDCNLLDFFEAYTSVGKVSERLEKIIDKLRIQNEEVYFLTELCKQTHTKLFFRFHKGDEMAILPIPCT